MKLKPEEVMTWPNAISAAGAWLAIRGAAKLDTQSGLAEATGGRMLDLLDGYVARKTGQTSEFGAGVDATLDKSAGLAIVVGEWRKDIAPKPVLSAMLAQNVLNGVATAIAKKRNPDVDLSPSNAGKKAMTYQNLALAAYAQSNMIRDSHPETSRTIRYAGHAAAAVGIGYYGVKATAGYFKRARAETLSPATH